MSYLKRNFLLSNKTAERLYFDYAEGMPVFDYHCHLPEKEILENKPFDDIAKIWLGGDHYKWRLMRNYGVDEDCITGNRPWAEKFGAYCRVLGTAYGNPLMHWSQTELETYFGCTLEINEKNAEKIRTQCNAYLKEHQVTPQMLIEQSGVKRVFTTNEIFDDLSTFEAIAKKGYAFRVTPAFRADKIMNAEAEAYPSYIDRLAGLFGKIANLDDLERAAEQRLQAFIAVGTCASDTALESVYPIADRAEADRIFCAAREGRGISADEACRFKGYFTYFLLGLYAKYDIRSELHIGAMRNNNTRMLEKLGLDTGYDSIAQDIGIKELSRLLDRLEREGRLPKMVIFNLNPAMNTEILTLLGCFQSGEAKGKLQYGAAWWFLDNKEGMEKHLRDLTSLGHLATFLGMLTDSRSFLSYPRHGYFRRILCNFLGTLMENGEMTDDIQAVGEVVKDICYRNATAWFGVDG